MSDIVKRLRVAAKCGDDDAAEAANEIARLRGLLERAAESLGRFCSDEGWTEADMDTLDACIAALPVTADQPQEATSETPSQLPG